MEVLGPDSGVRPPGSVPGESQKDWKGTGARGLEPALYPRGQPHRRARAPRDYSRGTKVLALTIPERSTILAALEDPPTELAELRGVLLRELAWLRSEGLA